MMRAALAVLATIAGAPVLAADTFALPPGCDGFLTIQSRSCSVEHHFTCAADPDGVKRRVSLSEDGMTYLGSTDTEAQWLTSYYPFTGHRERLAEDPADPASLTNLLTGGEDSYDFTTLSDEIGTTRYVGQDRLTGRTVTIDDVALQETAYEIAAFDADGTQLWSSSGNEFVLADRRMFIGGTGTVIGRDGPFDKDDRPVQFIMPGETGFLSANPKFDCGAVLSSAPQSMSTPEETFDDQL